MTSSSSTPLLYEDKKILINRYKSNLTVKISLINNTTKMDYLKYNQHKNEKPIQFRNSNIKANFMLRNTMNSSRHQTPIFVDDETVDNFNKYKNFNYDGQIKLNHNKLNGATTARTSNEKEALKFPIIEFRFDEKAFNNNTNNSRNHSNLKPMKTPRTIDDNQSRMFLETWQNPAQTYRSTNGTNTPTKRSFAQVVTKNTYNATLGDNHNEQLAVMPTTSSLTVYTNIADSPSTAPSPVTLTTTTTTPLNTNNNYNNGILRNVPSSLSNSTTTNSNDENNKNRQPHVSIIPIEFNGNKKNNIKSRSLLTHNTESDTKLIKKTDEIPQPITTRSSTNALKSWRRLSKVGIENERELNDIFKRIYSRNVSTIKSPVNDEPFLITKSLPFNVTTPTDNNNKTTSHSTLQHNEIETTRKNGKLCSKC